MKKQMRKDSRPLRFGDLVVAVSSCSRNNREAVAAVADLLERGRVRLLQSGGRTVRARVW